MYSDCVICSLVWFDEKIQIPRDPFGYSIAVYRSPEKNRCILQRENTIPSCGTSRIAHSRRHPLDQRGDANEKPTHSGGRCSEDSRMDKRLVLLYSCPETEPVQCCLNELRLVRTNAPPKRRSADNCTTGRRCHTGCLGKGAACSCRCQSCLRNMKVYLKTHVNSDCQ